MAGSRAVHRPEFSLEELEEPRRLAIRHNAPFSEVMRARLALLIHEEPDLSHAEAGRRIGLDRETVYKWRRRWAPYASSIDRGSFTGQSRVYGREARESSTANGLRARCGEPGRGTLGGREASSR
jgi:transposase-like protein